MAKPEDSVLTSTLPLPPKPEDSVLTSTLPLPLSPNHSPTPNPNANVELGMAKPEDSELPRP